MQTLNTAFERELRKLIEETIANETVDLTAGLMSPEVYKMTCGRIGGYRNVIEMFAEVNKRLSER